MLKRKWADKCIRSQINPILIGQEVKSSKQATAPPTRQQTPEEVDVKPETAKIKLKRKMALESAINSDGQVDFTAATSPTSPYSIN
jgi:hypothetical protein